MYHKVTGKRREKFIKREAERSSVSVAFMERMMKKQKQSVVECGCGHPCCKARDGLLIVENKDVIDPSKT